MNIQVCFSPLLYPAYKKDNNMIVVVVDIFRATTTICAAIANGAASVIPVATMEEAKEYKNKGFLVGGEKNMHVFEFGDFGNSPTDYLPEKVKGKDIVMSTTNGTWAIKTAEECDCLIIGSFSNLSSVARYCSSADKDIMVLCAGWKGRFNIEDTLFGGALVESLLNYGFNASYDSARIALSMWKDAKNDLPGYIRISEHIKRLESNGLSGQIAYCLTPDTVNVLPVYDRVSKKIADRLKYDQKK